MGDLDTSVPSGRGLGQCGASVENLYAGCVRGLTGNKTSRDGSSDRGWQSQGNPKGTMRCLDMSNSGSHHPQTSAGSWSHGRGASHKSSSHQEAALPRDVASHREKQRSAVPHCTPISQAQGAARGISSPRRTLQWHRQGREDREGFAWQIAGVQGQQRKKQLLRCLASPAPPPTHSVRGPRARPIHQKT
jgi:hypothetical protein